MLLFILSDFLSSHLFSRWTFRGLDVNVRVNMTIVFTDLDGSLLDPETNSWNAARPALELLDAQGVPWVMVSSKTREEIEELRGDLGHPHPFVVENGGAVYIPHGYFGFPVDNALVRDGYETLEWGTPYRDLVLALKDASATARCPVTGFHEMSLDQVCAATGLSPQRAALAMRREYDEPFLAPANPRIPQLLTAIEQAGFRWTHGGRFYHICGNNDKATAVAALLRLFTRQHGHVTSIGLGDGLNDLPMLKAVDIPVLIRSRRPPSIHFRTMGARYTRSVGPQGWSEAVMELLADHSTASVSHRWLHSDPARSSLG